MLLEALVLLVVLVLLVGPMLLEALALLAVSASPGVLEVFGRTVGIYFALASCRCSVIPLRELYFHPGNRSQSND